MHKLKNIYIYIIHKVEFGRFSTAGVSDSPSRLTAVGDSRLHSKAVSVSITTAQWNTSITYGTGFSFAKDPKRLHSSSSVVSHCRIQLPP